MSAANIRMALVSLALGALAALFMALPTVPGVALLCAVVYGCGVMDGRAGRRGSRIAEAISRAVRAVSEVIDDMSASIGRKGGQR